MTHAATIIVIGGSGFLGRHLTDHLIHNGYQVVIVSRHSQPLHHINETKWVTNSHYSQDELTHIFKSHSEDSCVINLVGQLHDKPGTPYGPGFKAAHVDLPLNIIEAMNATRLYRFIHISSLGANINAQSMYQRSKGAAEHLIRESTLNWTILRPSVIFGRDDQFIQLFASLCRLFPVIPLASSVSCFQPVYVGDVALAICQSIRLEKTFHQTIDLAGPKVYSLKELVEFAGKTVNKKPLVLPMPYALGYVQAMLFEFLPGKTLMSRDNLASMATDNVLADQSQQSLRDIFNLIPTPLEALMS